MLARIALLTAASFLLLFFAADRALDLSRTVLALAAFFQMVGAISARMLRRAAHERALDSFAPLKSLTDRAPQAPELLLIGPTSAAETYLREAGRRRDNTWTPVGIIALDSSEVGQQVRGVCIIESLGRLDEALVDFSETALFEIDRELGETFPTLSRTAALVDVRNADRVAACVLVETPDLVFHAAALKHVSMVERHPVEGVLTNVLGTWNVAEAARIAGAAQMVLISTDKAVDPSNVMGATKRLAEAVIQGQQEGSETRFSAVRFGNVLGSAGSVVPIFRSQIDRGGPVTVTHPEMARYFMTIPEAAQLVLHATAACAYDLNAERSRLFLLEMGEPVKIMDLARQMIALSGRTVGKDIEIEITGLRPGEKLTEELLDEMESAIPCAPKVLEVVSTSALGVAPAHLRRLEAIATLGDTDEIRRAIFDLVAQIRGEKPAVVPDLRVVSNR